MKKYSAVAGLLTVTVVWGGGFVVSDIALNSLTPFQIMVLRFMLSSLIFGLMYLNKLKTISKKEFLAGSLMGMTLFSGFAFQILGLQYTTASKNAFLTAANVVIVPFISFIIYKNRVKINEMIGALTAMLGVGLLSLNGDFKINIGDILTLLGALGFAFHIFMTGEFVKKYDADILNGMQMFTAFILSFVFMLIKGEIFIKFTSSGVVSVLYLGAVSTALTYLLQTNCQKYINETKAAIILSMESVFGTILSILILHEHMTLKMFSGCILLLSAVIVSNCFRESGNKKKKV